MREIKFRVWCEYTFEGIKHTDMATAANWFLLTQTGHLFSHDPMRPLDTSIEKDYDKLVVEFYTGFNDKDGVESYHHDLVKSKHYEGIGEIIWTGTGWAVQVKGDNVFYALRFEFIIVGNRHQHPELLEKP